MKKLIALILVAAIAGGAAYYFLRDDSDGADDTAPATSSVSNSAKSVEVSEDVVSDYESDYTISDAAYGTEVTVTVDAAANTRTIVSNALPNHDTGEFPNDRNPNAISAQNNSYTYPLTPTFIGVATNARTPGVALNGVKFEPATAERATCSSGQVHAIEAIQDIVGLGLDFNNAHVQPTGSYHYHGISNMLAEIYDTNSDLVHVGFAADGHLIYYSKSNAYKSSYQVGGADRDGTDCTYSNPVLGDTVFGPEKDGTLTSDWDYVQGLGDLDECNGITINGDYVYMITNEFPFVSRCLMGEFTESAPGGGGQPPNQGQTSGPPPSGGPRN